MFELDEWAFGHDKLEPAYLLERFDALVAEKKTVAAKLKKNLPTVKARSLAQADLIADIVRARL